MKADALQATSAKRGKPVVVLQPAELALDRCPSSVQVAEPLAVASDAREQPTAESLFAGALFFGFAGLILAGASDATARVSAGSSASEIGQPRNYETRLRALGPTKTRVISIRWQSSGRRGSDPHLPVQNRALSAIELRPVLLLLRRPLRRPSQPEVLPAGQGRFNVWTTSVRRTVPGAKNRSFAGAWNACTHASPQPLRTRPQIAERNPRPNSSLGAGTTRLYPQAGEGAVKTQMSRNHPQKDAKWLT